MLALEACKPQAVFKIQCPNY